MDSPYRQELLVAFDALQAASNISRQVLSTQDKGVLEKDDLSPVTVADFAIQALLTASIHAVFPDDKFVGEESSLGLRQNPVLLHRVWELLRRAGQDAEAPTTCTIPESPSQVCDMIDWSGFGVPPKSGDERVWVFDPIDGTKTFVRAEMYAINVCLLQGGRQIVSAVACPLLSMDSRYPVHDRSVDPSGIGCILFAVRGHGTYVRPLPGPPGAVQVRRIERMPAETQIAHLRSVSCFEKLDSGVDDIHRAVCESLGVPFPGCDLLGWVPRWSVLALGIANMTVWVYKRRERHAKIWDHAGAMLLFEEMGGKVTDVDGKAIDLTAGRHLSANFGFVAAPADIHPAVLKAVHNVMKANGRGSLLAE